MSDGTVGPGNSEIVTPIGAELSDNSASNTQVTAEPSVVDIADENTLIRVKGSDKPVKYGEHIRGFQSQFTKASQRAAQLERDVATRDARLAEIERQQNLQRTQSQQPQAGQDIYSQLEALPYLDGKMAAQVVQGIGSQIQQRDQIMLGLLNQVKSLKEIVGGLHGSAQNSSFEAKIDRHLSEGGYSPALKDLATELYLAYEPGPDLDQAFPQLLADRVAQIRASFESERTQALNAARKQPFVPGRGGSVGPSKPLTLDPRADSRTIADQLWNAMQVEGT